MVGLGNPGPQYELTRHNAGFLILDQIADQNNISFSHQGAFGDFAKGQLLNQECYFQKPQTYINRSGLQVSALARYFKIPIEQIIVIHDDLDMESCKVKTRLGGGGHGGHNGIRSITQELGSSEFHRIKIGIGRPPEKWSSNVSDWVLSQLSQEELHQFTGNLLKEVLSRIQAIFLSQIEKN